MTKMERLDDKITLKFNRLEPAIRHLEEVCVEGPLARFWESCRSYPKVFGKFIWPPIRFDEKIYKDEIGYSSYSGYISAKLNPTEIAESEEENTQLNKLQIKINIKWLKHGGWSKIVVHNKGIISQTFKGPILKFGLPYVDHGDLAYRSHLHKDSYIIYSNKDYRRSTTKWVGVRINKEENFRMLQRKDLTPIESKAVKYILKTCFENFYKTKDIIL